MGGDIEKPDDEVNFADACMAELSTEASTDSTQNGSFSRFTSILADKMANDAKKNAHGMALTGKQVRDGTQGIATSLSAMEKISYFQEYYPQFEGMVTEREMEAFKQFLETNDVSSALEFESWLKSNKTMQELASRKNVGREGTANTDNMDSLSLPNSGAEDAAGDMSGMGDMGAGVDTGAGGGFDSFAGDMGVGGDDMGLGDTFGAEAPAGEEGAGPDINEIGEVGKISENTSQELPNLGVEPTPTDDQNVPQQ